MGQVRKDEEVFVPTVLFAETSGKVKEEIEEEVNKDDPDNSKENFSKLLKEKD